MIGEARGALPISSTSLIHSMWSLYLTSAESALLVDIAFHESSLESGEEHDLDDDSRGARSIYPQP